MTDSALPGRHRFNYHRHPRSLCFWHQEGDHWTDNESRSRGDQDPKPPGRIYHLLKVRSPGGPQVVLEDFDKSAKKESSNCCKNSNAQREQEKIELFHLRSHQVFFLRTVPAIRSVTLSCTEDIYFSLRTFARKKRPHRRGKHVAGATSLTRTYGVLHFTTWCANCRFASRPDNASLLAKQVVF